MRIPEGYEDMIREIAKVAACHGFCFHHDTITDKIPLHPGKGHEFDVGICLRRQEDDFVEDGPISISAEFFPCHTGR